MTETSTPPDPPIAELFDQGAAAPSQDPDPAAAAPQPHPAMEAVLARVVRRLDRRARRTSAAALRDASFGWLADGFTHQEIAAARKVSVAVVRRDIARAIRARQPETREGHAQLQIARLTKGLALVADRIERGDMAAVGPLVKLVGALDRYQGGAPAPSRARSRGEAAALPAPRLALTHAASALAGREARERAARGGRETDGAPEPAADSESPSSRQPVEIMESRDRDPAPRPANALK